MTRTFDTVYVLSHWFRSTSVRWWNTHVRALGPQVVRHVYDVWKQ